VGFSVRRCCGVQCETMLWGAVRDEVVGCSVRRRGVVREDVV
jgi:hypothetical protein